MTRINKGGYEGPIMGVTTSDHSEESSDVKEVVREFLHQNDGIFAIELQKQCFAGELFCVERWNKRLTNAEFRAYMYGAYSDDLREILSELEEEDPEVWTKPAKRLGKPSEKYHSEYPGEGLGEDLDETSGPAPRSKRAIIEAICDFTQDMSVEELTELSKNNWPYQKTETGEVIDFARYRRALDQGHADPKLAPKIGPIPGEESPSRLSEL